MGLSNREKLTYVQRPTPRIVVGHRLLPRIIEMDKPTHVRNASAIFPRQQPAQAQEWNVSTQRCVRLLFILKHNLTTDDIQLIAGDAGRGDENRQILFSRNVMKHFNNQQSKSINRNPKQWFGSFVTGHVQLHDAKVHIHNYILRGLQLSRDVGGEDESLPSQTENQKEGQMLIDLANELKANIIESYDNEIEAVMYGNTSPFRFQERDVTRMNRMVSLPFRDYETRRLRNIRDQVLAWPECKWGEVDPMTCTSEEMPETLRPYEYMQRPDRLIFWEERTNLEVLASFYHSVLGDFEFQATFVDTAGNKTRFGKYATSRFTATCDDAYRNVFFAEITKENMRMSDSAKVRAAAEVATQTSPRLMYENSRNFFEKYNRTLVDGPPISMDDIKIGAHACLDSHPTRVSRMLSIDKRPINRIPDPKIRLG